MLDAVAGPRLQPYIPDPGPTRPDLGRIERDYQVQDDRMIDWEPSWVGWFVDSARITAHAQQYNRQRFQREFRERVDRSWSEFQSRNRPNA